MFQTGLAIFLITFKVLIISLQIQANLTNIMGTNRIKFQLDLVICLEGIMVLLENLLVLRHIPAIINQQIS